LAASKKARKGYVLSNDVRIAVLISGGGSNLEAILEAQEAGKLGRGKVVLVISNKPNVFGLERARKHQVPTVVVSAKALGGDDAFEQAMLAALAGAHVRVICLAGFLKKLSFRIIEKFRGHILNIHPSLLPKYGGPGMYGHFVHEAVMAAGEKESGCTVHMVDEEFDHGAPLAQVRVPVLRGDNPEKLAGRVLEQEHLLYPKTIAHFCEGLP
jgi:phosphoribosylglycinamide formyltransferase-1